MSMEKWSNIKDNIALFLNSELSEIAQKLSGDKNSQRDIIERIERVLTDKIIDDEKIETLLSENVELLNKSKYEGKIWDMSCNEVGNEIKEIVNDNGDERMRDERMRDERINFLYNTHIIKYIQDHLSGYILRTTDISWIKKRIEEWSSFVKLMDGNVFLKYTFRNSDNHRELLLFYENMNNSISSKVSIDMLEMMYGNEIFVKKNIYSIINILKKNKKNITTYISIDILRNKLNFSDDEIKSYCFNE